VFEDLDDHAELVKQYRGLNSPLVRQAARSDYFFIRVKMWTPPWWS
jgi:hypothetical protein